VEELDRFLRENGNATARHRRTFLEQRVAETHADLDATEDSLRDYQVAHRLPAVGADASKAASALGDLMGQRAALEVELGTLQAVERTPSARESELRMQIQQIDAQLRRIPPAASAMGRLYRSVKMQEAVLLVLTEEYEKAKLLELKNTPSVEVLDRAAPPIHKSAPHRSLLVLAGVVLAFLANALVVGVRATRLHAA
jgi:tyrosine-protein kinase Etk/Wzc